MGDFIKELYEDVVIEIVNMTRATLKEASEFKTILTTEIDSGCKKMIIDLSGCDYMDKALQYSDGLKSDSNFEMTKKDKGLE